MKLSEFVNTEDWKNIANQEGYAEGNIRVGQYLLEKLSTFQESAHSKIVDFAVSLFETAIKEYGDGRGYKELEKLGIEPPLSNVEEHQKLQRDIRGILRNQKENYNRWTINQSTFSESLERILDTLTRITNK